MRDTLNRAFRGQQVGPAKLSLSDVSFDFDFLSTLRGTIVDGCVSESVAARQ